MISRRNACISRSVLLPPELVRRVDEFIEGNKQLGYVTQMEFIREAVNETLSELSETKKVAEEELKSEGSN